MTPDSGITSARKAEAHPVRAAILAAAAEVLANDGADGFSLRRVASRAGYSAGTIYLHFENKDDLIHHTIEGAFAQFGERLDAAYLAFDEPLARIAGIIRAYVAFGLAHPVPYRLMFVDRAEYHFVERPTSGLDKLERLYQAVREAMADGTIRATDPIALVDALWAASHGVVALAVHMPFMDEARAEAMAEEALRLLYRGVRPDHPA